MYNKEVTFLRPEVSKNEVGEQVTSYTPIITTRANLKHISSDRDIENNEVLFRTVDIFTIRDYHKIQQDYRIKYRDKNYRILRILEEPDYRQITIEAEIVNE
jgi:SPP1 family predicted phage head-tail adaptor